jgi:hypothetical protein
MPLSSVIGAQSMLKPGVCTSTTRPASPYTGQMIYESDTTRLRLWNGTAWSTVTHSTAISVEYLVVAGGGGGGTDTTNGVAAGGGGAGGLLSGTLSVSGTVSVTVGGGGAGGPSTRTRGTTGSDSIFSTITSLGGGGGSAYPNNSGYSGGSGGGGGGGGGGWREIPSELRTAHLNYGRNYGNYGRSGLRP